MSFTSFVKDKKRKKKSKNTNKLIIKKKLKAVLETAKKMMHVRKPRVKRKTK